MRGEKEPSDVEREDAFPAPVDASASAARRPSVPRLWSPSDGWPALPERFPVRLNRVYFSHCEKP